MRLLRLVAAWIFRTRSRPPRVTESWEAFIERLEKGDLLESQSFTARRAFQVQEFEDEGSSYFIELTDGSVLFLSGQYLYEYEDEGCFPCTSFVVRRHRHERDVLEIQCGGDVIEPEVVAPPFTGADHDSGTVPDDGQIIAVPYEKLKAERLAASR
jgi:hypothetical protein